MMGDIFRDLEKSATNWIKDLTTPPSGSWIDSPWEHMTFQLKKWFAPLLAGWFGINIKSTQSSKTEPNPIPDPNEASFPRSIDKENLEKQKLLRNEQAGHIANHLIRRDPNNKNVFSSWLDAGWK